MMILYIYKFMDLIYSGEYLYISFEEKCEKLITNSCGIRFAHAEQWRTGMSALRPNPPLATASQ